MNKRGSEGNVFLLLFLDTRTEIAIFEVSYGRIRENSYEMNCRAHSYGHSEWSFSHFGPAVWSGQWKQVSAPLLQNCLIIVFA